MKVEFLNKNLKTEFRLYNFSRDGYGLFESKDGWIYVCGISGVTALTGGNSYCTEDFNIPVRRLPLNIQLIVTQTE